MTQLRRRRLQGVDQRHHGGGGVSEGSGRTRYVGGLRTNGKATGGIAILRGNLAPEGSVVKLSGHERVHHEGPARVFDGEEAKRAAHVAAENIPGVRGIEDDRVRGADISMMG